MVHLLNSVADAYLSASWCSYQAANVQAGDMLCSKQIRYAEVALAFTLHHGWMMGICQHCCHTELTSVETLCLAWI